MLERKPQVEEISIGDRRTIGLREISLYFFRKEIELAHPNMWEEKSFDIGDILTLRYVRNTVASALFRPRFSRLYCQAVILRLDPELQDDRKIAPIDSYSCLYGFDNELWQPIQRDVKYDSYIGWTTRIVDGKGVVRNAFKVKERRIDDKTTEAKLEEFTEDLNIAESTKAKELALVDFFLPPLFGQQISNSTKFNA